MYQIFIASRLVVYKSKKDIDLLIKYLPLLSKKLFQLWTDKPKPKSQLCKNAPKKCSSAKLIQNNKASKKTYAKNVIAKEYNKNELAQAIVQTKRMKIHFFCNLKQKTDLDRISGENLLENSVIRPTYKFAKLVPKTSSKVWEPKTYNEALNDLIHRNRWRKAIDEELWNLDNY